ncbi:putative secreted protein [Xanthomonas oryzae pv. oryzae PXO99A]|uniref:Putative secreted protein n=2 Tax=Xanthomonas oryzae TaxID=347 RepID=A0A0K0GFD4_XANOP|nr:putative secreted protein [Xanthomonas oryzae pv. oryzae PXO99A]
MTAVATVRGVAASVCACLFSAALRNAAMQTAAANVPIQGKRAERSSSVSHWRYAWRHRGARATVTRQASQEAVQRLHAKGIPTHFLQDGQLMQEHPDGSVAVIEAAAPIDRPSAA